MYFTITPKNGNVFSVISRTTFSIFSTGHMIEAKNANLKGYNVLDLQEVAAWILKRQAYMLYQWCLLRYMLSHCLTLIPCKYYSVTPDCFTPDEFEIGLYIENPKFLWRFSVVNYSYIINLIESNSDNNHSIFLTYNYDSSGFIRYFELRTSCLSNHIKEIVKPGENGVCNSNYSTKIHGLIDQYFVFQLNKYETIEYLYADDFYLQLMNGDTTYEDFLTIILTGQINSKFSLPCRLKQLLLDHKEKLYRQKVKKFDPSKLLNATNNEQENNQLINLAKYLDTELNNDPIESVNIINEINQVVESRKAKISITNELYLKTDWIDEVYTSDSCIYHPMNFFKFASHVFGFQSVLPKSQSDKNGKYFRYGWEINCEGSFLKKVINAYEKVFPNHNYYDHYYSRLEQLKISPFDDYQVEKVLLALSIDYFSSKKLVNCRLIKTYARKLIFVDENNDAGDKIAVPNINQNVIAQCNSTEPTTNVPLSLLSTSAKNQSALITQSTETFDLNIKNRCLSRNNNNTINSNVNHQDNGKENLKEDNNELFNQPQPLPFSINREIAIPILDFCGILFQRKEDGIIRYLPFKYFDRKHAEYTMSRCNSLFSILKTFINNSRYSTNFQYSKDFVNEILKECNTHNNFISLKIIPFDIKNFEEAVTSKKILAQYLALYYIKHNGLLTQCYEDLFNNYMKVQERSKLHLSHVYSMVKDRVTSEMYLAFQYIRMLEKDETMLDAFEYEIFHMDYIRKRDVRLYNQIINKIDNPIDKINIDEVKTYIDSLDLEKR